MAAAHQGIAEAEIGMVFHAAAGRIIPCAVHMAPFAIDFDQVPGVIHFGADDHVIVNAQFIQQQLICAGIALAHTGSPQKHTVGAIVGIGKVIVCIRGEPVMQPEGLFVFRGKSLCPALGSEGGHLLLNRISLTDASGTYLRDKLVRFFVDQKSGLVRGTRLIFHPLVDGAPAHAGLFLDKMPFRMAKTMFCFCF